MLTIAGPSSCVYPKKETFVNEHSKYIQGKTKNQSSPILQGARFKNKPPKNMKQRHVHSITAETHNRRNTL